MNLNNSAKANQIDGCSSRMMEGTNCHAKTKPNKMHHNYHTSLLGLSVFACCVLAASMSNATLLLHVSFQTSPLIGSSAGPFYVDFQLNDGSGSGDMNNNALIENFGGVNLVGPPRFIIGGASGSLSPHSSVSIKDTQFLNEFTQQFEPGPILTFRVTLSLKIGESPTPDLFSFSILDSTLTPFPTSGVGGALLWVNIDSTKPAVRTSGSGDLLFAPRVSVPEAGSSISMLLVGLGAVWCFGRRFCSSF